VTAYWKARRKAPFDVVHGHEFSGAWVALFARLERILLGRGPRVVTTMQCSFLRESRVLSPETPREWIDRWIDFPFRYLEGILGARLSDQVVGVSKASCRQIGTDYLGASRRVRRIPNGVDPHRFHPGVDGEAARRAWGLEEGEIILFAGRFVRRKGVEVLLRAFREIAHLHPRAHLVILGRGRRDYGALIGRLGLGDRVRVLPGRPHSEMPAAHAASDIFCLPSLYEGMPLAILEAMATGRPVIATRTDGIPEVVRHGETGILVEPGRVGPLARAMDTLLGDPRLRRRLGEAGRRVAAEKFSWDEVMRRYGEIFR
jgi:glycosyltransferase involved in cell wall biosynthesis